MFQRDPFSGHVVLRSTDTVSAGSDYKLWTTLKVPQGFSLQAHGELLAKKVGAGTMGAASRMNFSECRIPVLLKETTQVRKRL